MLNFRISLEPLRYNKHLPGISSAKEIESNDNMYDLSEMVEKLLIKVEELTLHTISQQDQIEELSLELRKYR